MARIELNLFWINKNFHFSFTSVDFWVRSISKRVKSNIMKFAVFAIWTCLCICLVRSKTITNYGNVTGRLLGSENVVVESSFMKVKNYTFTFPKVSELLFFNIVDIIVSLKFIALFNQEPTGYAIRGIKHVDNKHHPVSAHFVKGEIGHTNITIDVRSKRNHGINSVFLFYTN